MYRRLSVGVVVVVALRLLSLLTLPVSWARSLSLPSSLGPGIGGLSLLFSYFCKQRILCHSTEPTFTKPPVT